MNKANKIKSIIEQSRSKLMSVDFKKADGTIRKLSFNPKHVKGIKGDSASESSKKALETRKTNNPDLISVIDN